MKKRIWIAGDPGKFFRYARAVEAAGGTPCFSGGPWSLEDCDGLILPGGGDVEPWRYGQENTASRNLDPARDREDMELLEKFTALGKPVLGICRGMQVVNVFFGGTLIQDLPGHNQINGKDRLHPVRTAAGPFRDLWGEHCQVNSAHHQAADRLGGELEAVQWASDGVVEAVCHRRLPVWGVQWHPERLGGFAGEDLFRAFLRL